MVCDFAAGHHVGNLTPPSTDGISTYSHKKKRSRPAAALRRMVDDANLGDEDAAARWRQTHPKSDVILHDDPPAVHHQDIDADDDDDGWIGSGQEMQNAGEEYRNVMTMLRKKEQTRKVPPSLLYPVCLLWVLQTIIFSSFYRSK